MLGPSFFPCKGGVIYGVPPAVAASGVCMGAYQCHNSIMSVLREEAGKLSEAAVLSGSSMAITEISVSPLLSCTNRQTFQ